MNDLNRGAARRPRATAIEYSLLVSLLTVVAVAAFDAAGGSVHQALEMAADTLSAAISA